MRCRPPLRILVAAAFLLTTRSALAQAPTPPPVTTEVFANNVDSAGTDLRWDRYQPAGAGPWPAIVLLHVGGFKGGPRGPADVALDLQAAGFLVFAAEYRLAPPALEMLDAGPPGNPQFDPPSDGRPPEQTNDVAAAIVAARHDVHCNGKVVALGGSAGASHSMFSASFSGEAQPDVVVSLSGIYDFSDIISLSESPSLGRNPEFDDNCQNYLDFTSYLDPFYNAAARAASPDYQTNITTTRVPILFISADADMIPSNQFDLLKSLLTANSADFESIWRVTGSNVGNPEEHAFAAWTHPTTIDTGPPIVRDYVIDFLNRKLAGIPTPTPTPSPTPTPPGSTPTPTPSPSPTPAQPNGLLNISTRLQVRTGDGVLIGGFIVTGTSEKTVLIRALGPSLAGVGVPKVLRNPEVELYDSSGTLLYQNSDWTTLPPGTVPVDLQPSSPLEAVISANLPPGNYTAVLRGEGGTTGVALCEAYDLSPAASSVKNISTRGDVGLSDDAMIGGFIIGGTTPTRVLLRGIGPSLAAAGITGALADPVMELHDSTGSVIFTNDNWRDTQEQQIIATTIPPTDDRESAIVATLAPGAYTAILRGVNNTTGVALIEVYSLD